MTTKNKQYRAESKFNPKAIASSLEQEVVGAGKDTLVFIHGYPDTMALWDNQVRFFQKRYRVARLTLPGFEQNSPVQKPVHYNQRQMRAIIDAFIESLGVEKVIVVAHDFGAVYARSYLNEPGQVKKLILLDVGPYGDDKPAPINGIYAALFAVAWLFPNGLSRKLIAFNFKTVLRKERVDKNIDDAHLRKDPHLVYPYYHAFRDLFTGKIKEAQTPYAIPLLFLYGTDKEIILHGRSWEKWLSEQEGSGVKIIPGGHWFMLSHWKETNNTIADWLDHND